MDLILAQTPISKIQLEKIEEYWKSEKVEFNDEVLDTFRRYLLTLRMPINLIKGDGFMNIDCQLSAVKTQTGFLLTLTASNNKALLMSILLGCFCTFILSLVALASNSYIVLLSILGVVIGIVYYGYLISKMRTFSAYYLQEFLKKIDGTI